MSTNLIIRLMSVGKAVYWLFMAVLYHIIKFINHWSLPSRLIWSEKYINRHSIKCQIHDDIRAMLSIISGITIVLSFLYLAENDFENGFLNTLISMLPFLLPSVIYIIFVIDNLEDDLENEE